MAKSVVLTCLQSQFELSQEVDHNLKRLLNRGPGKHIYILDPEADSASKTSLAEGSMMDMFFVVGIMILGPHSIEINIGWKVCPKIGQRCKIEKDICMNYLKAYTPEIVYRVTGYRV